MPSTGPYVQACCFSAYEDIVTAKRTALSATRHVPCR